MVFEQDQNHQDDGEGIREIWNQRGNCISMKNVQVHDLWFVLVLSFVAYLLEYFFLLKKHGHKLEKCTTIIITSILLVKVLGVAAIGILYFAFAQDYTEEGDLFMFNGFQTVGLSLIGLLTITDFMLVTLFYTKMYRALILMKHASQPPAFIMNKIKKTKIYSAVVIAFMYMALSVSHLQTITFAFQRGQRRRQSLAIHLVQTGIQVPSCLFLLLLVFKYARMQKRQIRLLRSRFVFNLAYWNWLINLAFLPLAVFLLLQIYLITGNVPSVMNPT